MSAPARSMKFNPAFLDDETLVKSFVVRGAELDRIIEVIRENTGAANQHLLVIGPRGIGKTTLVVRTAAEVRADSALRSAWHPIVFGEETYQVTTPGEFWLEALFHLGQQTGEARWQRAHDELRLERDEARLRARALAQLMDFADEQRKRLLLVVENLNMLVGSQISSDDAWALRHTLMNEPRLMLLGTATSRFAEIDEYNQALYELFRMIELQPLDQAEVKTLWASATGTDAPVRRIRPLQILTGSNPRLIRILSEFAATTSFSSLMENLTRLVDAHTEYFKHHLDSLPPQERKVFVVLADLWDPSTARAVADAARIEVNTASALLKRLLERGAVTAPYRRGRAQFYQVAERMYNIYHLLRRRGQGASRVHAVVRFMVSLYRDEELVQTTRSLVEEASLLSVEHRRDHLAAFEAIMRTAGKPSVASRILEIARAALAEMPDLPASLRAMLQRDHAPKVDPHVDDAVLAWLAEAGEHLQHGRDEQALKLSGKILARDPTNFYALNLSGVALVNLNRADEAVEAFHRVVAVHPNYSLGWATLAALLNSDGRFHEAVELIDRALALITPDAGMWVVRADALAELGREEEALESYDRAIHLTPDDANLWLARGHVLFKLGRPEEALATFDEVVSRSSENADAWERRGVALEKLNRHEEALASFDRALSIDATLANAWATRGLSLLLLYRGADALESIDRALAIDDREGTGWGLRGVVLEALNRDMEAAEAYDRALQLDPDLAFVLGWRGGLHRRLQRSDLAENDLRLAIAITPDAEDSTATLFTLLFEQGRRDEAFALLPDAPPDDHSAEFLNALSQTIMRVGGTADDLARAEKWSRTAMDRGGSDVPAFAHTYAVVLGCQGKWDEALAQTPRFLTSEWAEGEGFDECVDFLIEAVAAGYEDDVVRRIEAAGLVEAFEPLITAVRSLSGAELDVAREISEIASDVVRRIQQKRGAAGASAKGAAPELK